MPGGDRLAQPPLVVDVHPRDDVGRAHPGQLEHLAPVAEVGAHAEVRDPPQLPFGSAAAQHAAQVGLQPGHPLAVPRPHGVGECVELTPGERLRHAAHLLPVF